MGDLSGTSKKDFDARYEEITKSGTEWTRAAEVGQVWKFMRLEEGDKIVANRGTEEVLGLGTVTGDYYFVSECAAWP
ncbi:MAG: hypothetical protein MZV63_40340 [Marinilabiliales bacterium]|nr:hypothetical protein [Marinilabiliales bacterium]